MSRRGEDQEQPQEQDSPFIGFAVLIWQFFTPEF